MHRSTLNRRRILIGGSGYITTGLFAHFDAINNTGNGHSSTTKTWYDLSPNKNNIDLGNSDELLWHDNYISYNTGIRNSTWLQMPVSPNYTIEYVLSTSVPRDADSNMNFYTLSGSYSANINCIRLPTGVFVRIRGSRYTFTFDSDAAKLHSISIVVKPPNAISLFCNGALIDNRAASIPTLDVVYGALGYNNGEDPAPSKDIKLSACRFYSRALNSAEILQNFTKDKEIYLL